MSKFDLEPYQAVFFNSRARYPAMVSAWGTGKTMVALMKCIELTESYPNNLGLIVRQDFTDLRDSTMRDFELYTGRKVPTNKDVEFRNGSRIMFRHGSELKKLQNINLGWFFIEQAEEFESDQEFQLLRGRLRRKGVFHQGIIIANTNGHNWIWRLWKNSSDPEYNLVEATTFDNPHLPPEFQADLAKMKEQSPATYRRWVLNSWEDSDTADKVIPYSQLMDAINKELILFKKPGKVVVCDPAEFGDDHSVIYAMEGGKIIAQEILAKKEPMETAGRILRMFRQTKSHVIGVDADGIGAGIRSRLTELGAPVVGIKAGSRSSNPDSWVNLKAEMWMNAQDAFREGWISLPDDEKLIEDLAAHTYTVDSRGRVTIEQKKDVKKKLGRSPDQGDAFVMGLWMLKKCPTADIDEYKLYETEMANSYSVKSIL